MLLVFAMKCCSKMPCPMPHKHYYCCLLSLPICLPHLLICTCLISSPIACFKMLARHRLCYVDVYWVLFVFFYIICYISLWLYFGLFNLMFVYIFLSDCFFLYTISFWLFKLVPSCHEIIKFNGKLDTPTVSVCSSLKDKFLSEHTLILHPKPVGSLSCHILGCVTVFPIWCYCYYMSCYEPIFFSHKPGNFIRLEKRKRLEYQGSAYLQRTYQNYTNAKQLQYTRVALSKTKKQLESVWMENTLTATHSLSHYCHWSRIVVCFTNIINNDKTPTQTFLLELNLTNANYGVHVATCNDVIYAIKINNMLAKQ